MNDKKKALVTGAAGFIAPHMIEACTNRGWDVLGVDILDSDFKAPGYVFKKQDLRDLTVADLTGFDYIFHLAFVTNIPYTIEHPLESTRDNIDMTAYLLDLATKVKLKKFLFPSTASLYGHNPTPWKEDMPAIPIEPYAWHKLACEQALQMWTQRYGLPTVILRLFQVFGENPRWDSALTAFLKCKREGRPITLTMTSPGSKYKTGQRDFIYVKDVAEAFVRSALSEKTGKGEIINIASGKITTMESVARMVGDDITFIPKRSYEVERHEADTTKARELLGWLPSKDVLDWLKEFMKGQYETTYK